MVPRQCAVVAVYAVQIGHADRYAVGICTLCNELVCACRKLGIPVAVGIGGTSVIVHPVAALVDICAEHIPALMVGVGRCSVGDTDGVHCNTCNGAAVSVCAAGSRALSYGLVVQLVCADTAHAPCRALYAPVRKGSAVGEKAQGDCPRALMISHSPDCQPCEKVVRDACSADLQYLKEHGHSSPAGS